jgi:adenylate kinase family enzyme
MNGYSTSLGSRLPGVEPGAKKVVVVTGISGAGKSVHCEVIGRFLCAPVYHLGSFCRTADLTPELREEHERLRSRGALLTGVTERFLATIANDPCGRAVIDGFPRSTEQAAALREQARRRSWNITIVHLGFPRQEEAHDSLERQLRRFEQSAGRSPTDEELQRIHEKIRRYARLELSAVRLLEETGVHVAHVPASGKTFAQVSEDVFGSLHLGSDELRWDLPRLGIVLDGMRRSGIEEAFVVSGLFYRPFWDERFGPPQLSVDVDVTCRTREEVARLGKVLRAEFPEIRWATASYMEAAERNFRVHEPDFLKGRARNPLRWRQGGILLKGQEFRIVATPEALCDLRSGTLRIDEALFDQLPGERRREVLVEARARAGKALDDYPLLRIEGILADVMQSNPKNVARKGGFHRCEREEGGVSRWQTGLLPGEMPAAHRLRALMRGLTPSVSPVPIPPRTRLLGVIGRLQELKEHSPDAPELVQSVEPPCGYQTWFHFIACRGTDGQFREWLLNQARSRTPLGGADPFVQSILKQEFLPSSERIRLASRGWAVGTQRSTHQGILLPKHHLWSALCLETDDLASPKVSSGVRTDDLRDIRVGIRIGTLCHDVGKVLGPEVTLGAGFHENAGVGVWRRFLRPDWVSDKISAIVCWCIQNHSLLGRLNRAIDEKIDGVDADVDALPSYPGAVDPSFIRSQLARLPLSFELALAACCALQKADIASIPTIRYLLPVVEVCTDVVTSGMSVSRAGAADD